MFLLRSQYLPAEQRTSIMVLYAFSPAYKQGCPHGLNTSSGCCLDCVLDHPALQSHIPSRRGAAHHQFEDLAPNPTATPASVPRHYIFLASCRVENSQLFHDLLGLAVYAALRHGRLLCIPNAPWLSAAPFPSVPTSFGLSREDGKPCLNHTARRIAYSRFLTRSRNTLLTVHSGHSPECIIVRFLRLNVVVDLQHQTRCLTQTQTRSQRLPLLLRSCPDFLLQSHQLDQFKKQSPATTRINTMTKR